MKLTYHLQMQSNFMIYIWKLGYIENFRMGASKP